MIEKTFGFLIALVFILCFSLPCSCAAIIPGGNGEVLRIGLTNIGFPKIFYLIPSDGQIEIFDRKKKDGVFSGKVQVVTVRLSSGKLQIFADNKNVCNTSNPVVLSPVGRPPHFLWIGSTKKLKNAFRASIEISPRGSRLMAINIVDMPNYLKSVVPAEIGTKAPFTAFCVQAIAARTYALFNLLRHQKEGCHLCDKPHCQVYFGISKELPDSSRSVKETKGLVLMYENEFANTVYHCNCGGRLKSCKEVWGGKSVPYLVSHLDSIGADRPFCSWTTRGGTNNKGISSQKSAKSKIISSISQKRTSKFAFHKSRGHQVGLCQDGAIGMGHAGYSYPQILSFYYPNTALGKLRFPKSKPQAQTIIAANTVEPKQFFRPGEFVHSTSLTKGKRTKDFRKWFWCSLQPHIYQKGKTLALVPELDNGDKKKKKV